MYSFTPHSATITWLTFNWQEYRCIYLVIRSSIRALCRSSLFLFPPYSGCPSCKFSLGSSDWPAIFKGYLFDIDNCMEVLLDGCRIAELSTLECQGPNFHKDSLRVTCCSHCQTDAGFFWCGTLDAGLGCFYIATITSEWTFYSWSISDTAPRSEF